MAIKNTTKSVWTVALGLQAILFPLIIILFFFYGKELKNERKNEQNYQNSQNAIFNAFFQMLEKRSIDANITVSEICLKAKINRSTFYRHYLDVSDLSEKISVSLVTPCFKNSDDMESFIRKLLEVIKNNKVYFAYYLKHNPNQFSNPNFVKVWNKSLVPLFTSYGVKKEEKMRYYFSYFTGGLVAVISNWIDAGCKEEVDEIFDIITNCGIYSPFINKNVN